MTIPEWILSGVVTLIGALVVAAFHRKLQDEHRLSVVETQIAGLGEQLDRIEGQLDRLSEKRPRVS